jgi:hypothetical protein
MRWKFCSGGRAAEVAAALGSWLYDSFGAGGGMIDEFGEESRPGILRDHHDNQPD